jgi:hypothetical protein
MMALPELSVMLVLMKVMLGDGHLEVRLGLRGEYTHVSGDLASVVNQRAIAKSVPCRA